jgi:hypothetical protein
MNEATDGVTVYRCGRRGGAAHGEAVATTPGLRVEVRWQRGRLRHGGGSGQSGCNRCGGEEGVVCAVDSGNPAVLLVIKYIYLPSIYLYFIQDIEDRCLLLMSSMSCIDLPL